MGFLKDFIAPTTHVTRHEAAERAATNLRGKSKTGTCLVPGCSKSVKPGRQYHGTCGRERCQAFVTGGW